MIEYPPGAIQTFEELEEITKGASLHRPVRAYATAVWDEPKIREFFLRPGCILGGPNRLITGRGNETIYLLYLNIPRGKRPKLTSNFLFTNYFMAYGWVQRWKAGLGKSQKHFEDVMSEVRRRGKSND